MKKVLIIPGNILYKIQIILPKIQNLQERKKRRNTCPIYMPVLPAEFLPAFANNLCLSFSK
jgi:myosin-crossreactive antigen